MSPTANGSAPLTSQVKVLDMGYLPSWGVLAADDLEENNLLKFPMSVKSYMKIRSDPQVQGLCNAVTWPIYRMQWYIEPGDAEPDWVERLAMDLGLPIGEDEQRPQKKTKNRFKFLEHLEQALEAVFLGFQVFEQKFEYVKTDEWLHLRKLLHIPPASIDEFNLSEDGGMNWIKQIGFDMPKLDINRLVWYAFQKRGANWTGRSLLRGCYGPWLLKDRAERIGVMNLQRAGVGTPIIEGPPGATDAELIILNRLAETFKGSEKSGGAIPAGSKFRLVGVEGSQPNAVQFVKLMNEEMARALLQMFMMAGQTGTGTRATAQTHLDFSLMTLEYIADWFQCLFNEHVIEDDWEWNYGPEVEDVPALRWKWNSSGSGSYGDQQAQAAENPLSQVQDQINNGDLQVPEDVAAALGAVPNSARHAGRRARGGRATRAAGGPSTAVPPLPLPSRTLRRQPYDHEIAAAVDYSQLDTSYQSALDLLVSEVRQLQGYQIEDLHDRIVDAAGDMAVLGELEANLEHGNVIKARLEQVAKIAAEEARNEAMRQGRHLDRPDTESLSAGLGNRASAVDNILTRDLASAASRNAVRLSGGSLSPGEVADQVRKDLIGRTDAYLREVLGGAVQQAINDGRGLVFKTAEPSRIYASEILDTATCVNCVSRDGTQYMNMDDAARDYPSGGYKDCLGRERCRGVLVAVYDETPATLDVPGGVS